MAERQKMQTSNTDSLIQEQIIKQIRPSIFDSRFSIFENEPGEFFAGIVAGNRSNCQLFIASLAITLEGDLDLQDREPQIFRRRLVS